MASKRKSFVDNDIYHKYGERWYTANDDPVALLRAETRLRNQWILSEIKRRFPERRLRILDLGCGPGFLTNELARHRFHVTGLDSSQSTLEVAARHDMTGTVDYCRGDANMLGFKRCSFDAVCAMDFLEHVEDPLRIVREVSTVLKPSGLFFFYTFNRNLISWLVVIKGVEWFIRNTPPHMHCLEYFIKPAELEQMCRENGLEVVQCRGVVPKVFRASFWKMLMTGIVDNQFAFKFTDHTTIGYIGIAVRAAAL